MNCTQCAYHLAKIHNFCSNCGTMNPHMEEGPIDVDRILRTLGIGVEKHRDPEYLREAVARLWRMVVRTDRLE